MPAERGAGIDVGASPGERRLPGRSDRGLRRHERGELGSPRCPGIDPVLCEGGESDDDPAREVRMDRADAEGAHDGGREHGGHEDARDDPGRDAIERRGRMLDRHARILVGRGEGPGHRASRLARSGSGSGLVSSRGPVDLMPHPRKCDGIQALSEAMPGRARARAHARPGATKPLLSEGNPPFRNCHGRSPPIRCRFIFKGLASFPPPMTVRARLRPARCVEGIRSKAERGSPDRTQPPACLQRSYAAPGPLPVRSRATGRGR